MNPKTAKHCGVFEPRSFERNNYFFGKQFTVRDMSQEQSYFNEKRRLINRAILGWGVVCGLDVCRDGDGFVVTPGMALDCCGREIIVCEKQFIDLNDYQDACKRAHENQDSEGKLVLCLEYDECKIDPLELPAQGCDQDEQVEYNRIRDGFKFKLKPWDKECHKNGGQCIRCLDYFKNVINDPNIGPTCPTKPLHEYLCDLSKKGCVECQCCACVVLATIWAPPQADEQPDPTGPRFDATADRRLVYSNDTLFKLIDCYHGDLPRIVDFSWPKSAGAAHEMTWRDFLALMKAGLEVTFDQAMWDQSFNLHTFIVSFLHADEGTGSIVNKRVPGVVQKVEAPGSCYKVRFTPDIAWVRDELYSKNTELADGVDVEITLRGSRILNQEKNKALDGEYLAYKLPTGNGTQGGDFIDWFRVLKRTDEEARIITYPDF